MEPFCDDLRASGPLQITMPSDGNRIKPHLFSHHLGHSHRINGGTTWNNFQKYDPEARMLFDTLDRDEARDQGAPYDVALHPAPKPIAMLVNGLVQASRITYEKTEKMVNDWVHRIKTDVRCPINPRNSDSAQGIDHSQQIHLTTTQIGHATSQDQEPRQTQAFFETHSETQSIHSAGPNASVSNASRRRAATPNTSKLGHGSSCCRVKRPAPNAGNSDASGPPLLHLTLCHGPDISLQGLHWEMPSSNLVTIVHCILILSWSAPSTGRQSLERRDPALTTSPSGNYAPVYAKCPDNIFLREPNKLTNGQAELSQAERNYIAEKAKKSVNPWRTYLQNVQLKDFDINAFLDEAEKRGGLAGDTLPNFGLSLSGGGGRALCLSSSILQAFDSRNPRADAAKVGGILQLSNYAVGVSGASWLLGAWATSNFPPISDIAPKWRLSEQNDLWDWNVAKHYRKVYKVVKQKKLAGFPTNIVE
ncbi:hypothetical protein KEM48_004567 [Puccinia striiformis f. sp. tritici PST-130]|nr:hypothetical protein KEM48_004567 [Puccinia striiformis f. sp. tritici PST-130]